MSAVFGIVVCYEEHTCIKCNVPSRALMITSKGNNSFLRLLRDMMQNEEGWSWSLDAGCETSGRPIVRGDLNFCRTTELPQNNFTWYNINSLWSLHVVVFKVTLNVTG